MIYIGIDISKNKHDCVILDQCGHVLQKPFTIANTRAGFNELINKISSCQQNLTDIKIGLESTGHYGYNLINFLFEHHYSVYVLNPLYVKQYHNCLSLRKTKTDRLDTIVIAKTLIANQNLQPYSLQAYHSEELKSLTRYRSTQITAQTKYKTSFTRLINLLFPELESITTSLHRGFIYDLLESFPGAKQIAHAPLSHITSILMQSSRGRIGKDFAIKIQQLARNSIGTQTSAKCLELRHTIAAIRRLKSEIAEIDSKIREIMDKIDSPILSIPGISYTTGATIIAEIGDFAKFSSPDKILAYAGMSPTTYQSGQYNNQNYARMEKRGSTYLRHTLFYATQLVCHREPSFNQYLAKKRKEGKHYYVAISHATKRLIRLIYAMEKNHQNYLPN